MLLHESFRAELVEQIEESNPVIFEGCGKTKEEILADSNLIDLMWCVYQKDIEEYGLDARDAFSDTLEDVLHIPATD